MVHKISGTLTLCLAGIGLAQINPERLGVESIPELTPGWFFVISSEDIYSKAYLVNPESQEVLGMIDLGYGGNLLVDRENSQVIGVDTFWSRGSRGTRSDLFTVYDGQTLSPTREIKLPTGRFLTVGMDHAAGLNSSGSQAYSFSMTPQTSVQMAELASGKVREIPLPGCYLVLPAGENRFGSLCSDGSLLLVDLAENRTLRSHPFFDPEADPVFDHAAWDPASGRGILISYSGLAYPVDLSETPPKIGQPWKLAPQDPGWRPGGWQLAAYEPGSGQLYVLMHEGEAWSHTQAGSEVWVFDTQTQTRVARFTLDSPGFSLSASPAHLLVTSDEEASLQIYNSQGKHMANMEELGSWPFLLVPIR